MIKTSAGHFWITFDNGYTLSLFNGFGSYTENHFKFEKQNEIMKHNEPDEWESEQIEIAIIREDLGFVTQDIIKEANDSVMTINTNELVEIINKVSKLGDTNVKD